LRNTALKINQLRNIKKIHTTSKIDQLCNIKKINYFTMLNKTEWTSLYYHKFADHFANHFADHFRFYHITQIPLRRYYYVY